MDRRSNMKTVDSTDMPHVAASEAGRALDALVALSAQLSCHCDVRPEQAILPARRVREACETVDAAVLALKKIVLVAEEAGGHPGLVA